MENLPEDVPLRHTTSITPLRFLHQARPSVRVPLIHLYPSHEALEPAQIEYS